MEEINKNLKMSDVKADDKLFVCRNKKLVQVDVSDVLEIQVNNPSTTYELQPNVQVVWGEVAELNITLASEKQNAINIYPFWFTSGATPTKVTLPATIILDGFVTKPNKKYCCQIEQNVLFWKEFEVEL